MLAASPARIMRRPPAVGLVPSAPARATIVDFMILAGEAASITTSKTILIPNQDPFRKF